MTLSELMAMLDEMPWFKRLAEPGADDRCLYIASLSPWADEPTSDETLERIADHMDWLPSSREQDDPIHGRLLEGLAEQIGKKKEISQQCLGVYKRALSSLSDFKGHPALKVGPHDFTEAAKGAALFASRRAAYEILLGKPGFWCHLMQIYYSGHWPCGILPSGQIVVL